MRTSVLLVISVLLAVPEASARFRAVGHRSAPWRVPTCTTSTGLASSGFMHGTKVVRPQEESDPWQPVFTHGLALGAAANTLYATRGGGIYESTDGGCTWRVRANVPEVLLPGRPAQVITRHPNRIYAYTSRDIVRITFGTVQVFALPDEMERIEVDPADPLHLRAIGFAGAIHDSRDGAATWTITGRVSASRIEASEFDPNNFDRIILHTGRFGQLAITTDGGKSWTYPQPAWWRVDTFEISPADPNVVWLSGAAGLTNPDLYRSTDGGKTFTVVVDYTSSLMHLGGRLAAHPTDPRIVAVPMNMGIAIVTDYAVTEQFTGAGAQETVWAPNGTLYFVDQQIRY
jgi:photosystem II stability/assembly factor-like uncharacterized protein